MDQPTRVDEIIAHVRDGIVAGELAPGARLPTRLDLQSSFLTSSTSVQQALDELVDEGFIESRGRLGTFVVEHPPHRCRFALAVRGRRGGPGWNEFWASLCRAAAEPSWRTGERRLEAVTGCDGRGLDDPLVARLVRHARVGAIAGVLHTSAPGDDDAAGWNRLDVPQVAIAMKRPPAWPRAVLAMDDEAVIDLALRRFAALGRHRVAALMFGGNDAASDARLSARIASHGMATRDAWIHGCEADVDARRWLPNWIALLLAADRDERPDALLIADDNLVAEASAGLRALGGAALEGLTVIAHANFPDPIPCAVPALRIGFDAREVLRAGVDLLARLRAGAPPSLMSRIEPRFADGWDVAAAG